MGRDDANLNDLAILSEDHVLAVGDRGLILRSDSSGRKWQTLASPTTANLNGIRFSPLGFGLAVGGWIGSSTRMSHAVVLRSLDGGRSWQAVPAPSLPRLTGLRVQENRCLAWGDYSPLWRTSLFESLDGGQSWRGLQFPRRGNRGDDNAAVPMGHATAAELSSHGDVGAVDVLGRAYFPGSNAADAKANLPTIAQPTQPLLALHHTGSNWLACGSQGELISSRDGAQWTNVVVPLSPAARQLCQWRAITQIEDTVWVCGYPGSILLTSPDRGATWQVKKTGQTLPLSAMHFVDQSRGWATGPLGLMLATRDAGQTWYAQRQRARRLGVLAISNTALDIPWAPLAAAAWDEQVAVAATVVQSIDPIEQADFLPSRWATYHDLAPQIGLAGLFSQSLTENSSTNFSDKMVLQLRCWRPDVVILADGKNQPVGQQRQLRPSLEGELLTAMKNSGEAHALTSDELDLPAWSATKLVSTCAAEQSQYSEQSSRLLRTPGISIWDCLLPLPPEDRRTTESSQAITTMRTVWTQSQAKSAFSTVLGAVPSTIDNQRQVNIQNIGNFQLVMGRVHRDRSMDRLAQTSNNLQSLEQWSSDLEFVMRSVPARESPAVLQRLAQQLSLSQHWPQRKVVCQRLIDVEPHSDIADWARWELLTLDVSDECAAWRRSDARRSGNLQQAASLTMPASIPGDSAAHGPLGSLSGRDVGAQTAAWNASPFGEVKPVRDQQPNMSSMVVSASAALPLAASSSSVPSTSDKPSSNSNSQVVSVRDATLFDANAGQMSALDGRSSQAETANAARHLLLHSIQIQSPVLLARPDLELRQYRCDRLAQPTIQSSDDGLARLKHLASVVPLIGWPQMAQQELGLLFGHADGLRWTATAQRADRPPLLDGTLNDPFWQRANAMELTELDATKQATQATQIRWAYDREYLYVGITSPRPKADIPLPVAERRGYDAELNGVDHVQLTLDTDRDYCTAIELGIAADGRTYDRCCGCADYNPKWHVSVRSQTGQWTAELAIELDALTTQTDLPGKAWAVSARRLQPDGNHQSWSRLRSHAAYLHASGLLLFAGPTQSE
jgi:photosystem II stability/assembly factor-like uncharacterized protein/nucleoid DNA-binding protein